MESFGEDYMRFTYIIKQLTLYNKTGDINIQLLLNHLIIVYNVFGNSATEILFDKSNESTNGQLCAFLVYLNRLPDDDFTTISGEPVKPSNMKKDEELFAKIVEKTA
jgi:hypothetical protein